MKALVLAVAALMLAACGGPAPVVEDNADKELPVITSNAEILAWINKGFYTAWKCEAAAHDGRSPSPHGKNRICSNAKLSAHTIGEYPVGAVGAKELVDAAGKITGYALEIKTKAGTGGDAWYWYEIQNAAVVASAANFSGCVGCHLGAGSDSGHSGHDFVYTQIK
jgi:hypothetical protein